MKIIAKPKKKTLREVEEYSNTIFDFLSKKECKFFGVKLVKKIRGEIKWKN
ncbi:MAG: hypothetical protein U9Q34_00520 [Elusimicrobiota bacterium]|nr:hypothetical protein [Elusimicrobiota bacterium]